MKLTKQQRAELKQKYGGYCAYCGVVLGDKWQADHLEPVIRDFEYVYCNKKRRHITRYTGEMQHPERDCIENMVAACIRCNQNKSSI